MCVTISEYCLNDASFGHTDNQLFLDMEGNTHISGYVYSAPIAIDAIRFLVYITHGAIHALHKQRCAAGRFSA